MPALFARCANCGYKFQFDYDLRQRHCQRCKGDFDWARGGNPVQEDSFMASGAFDEKHTVRDVSATDGRALEIPKLPGDR